MATKFEIKKVTDEDTGATLDCVVKVVDGQEDDVWCSIADLNTLFQTCVSKWQGNWDLNKVCVAIQEANFE
jgi:hypothetical protein